jgi:hypothetical protein
VPVVRQNFHGGEHIAVWGFFLSHADQEEEKERQTDTHTHTHTHTQRIQGQDIVLQGIHPPTRLHLLVSSPLNKTIKVEIYEFMTLLIRLETS